MQAVFVCLRPIGLIGSAAARRPNNVGKALIGLIGLAGQAQQLTLELL